MPTDYSDLVWIDDEAMHTEYKTTRSYLEKVVAAGDLSTAHINGDRKVYLLRSELDTHFTPQITRRDPKTQAG